MPDHKTTNAVHATGNSSAAAEECAVTMVVEINRNAPTARPNSEAQTAPRALMAHRRSRHGPMAMRAVKVQSARHRRPIGAIIKTARKRTVEMANKVRVLVGRAEDRE